MKTTMTASMTTFNLRVRFQRDTSDHAIWQVWREGGEIRCGLSSGYCYPWAFGADEIGSVLVELYARMGSQIAHVKVTPAIED